MGNNEQKVIGKAYIKTNKDLSFDIIEFKGQKYLDIPEDIRLELDYFNKNKFEFYEDIK